MGKNIDGKVLGALHLLSKNIVDGVNYMEFVKADVLNSALDLINEKFAEKIRIGEDNSNYRFTPLGQEYSNRVLQFAQEEFITLSKG